MSAAMVRREAGFAVKGITREALFSPCGKYRYELRIIWSLKDKPQVFIGLNPSTADERTNDPTLRRCIDFANRWGAGGLIMLNVFAWRETVASHLRWQTDPIGPANTVEFLGRLCTESFRVPIACWGRGGKLHSRDAQLTTLAPLDCLGINQDGTPMHPLYLAKETLPQPYWPPDRLHATGSAA